VFLTQNSILWYETLAVMLCGWEGNCRSGHVYVVRFPLLTHCSSDHLSNITGKGKQGNSKQDSVVGVDVWTRFSVSVRSERRIRSGQKFVAIFIDFLAAFDSVHCESMWKAMLVDGIPAKVMNILCNYYEGTQCSVRVYNEFTDSFNDTASVRQGCILSPMIFNIIIDWIMNRAGASPFVFGKDLAVHDLDYAYDIALLADFVEAGQTFLDKVATAVAKLGLRISGPKTKVVSFGYDTPEIVLDTIPLEVVPTSVYLGSSFSANSVTSLDEVECCVGKASVVFARLKECVWKRCNISLKTKMKIYNAVVITTLLYDSECWMLLATDLTKL